MKKAIIFDFFGVLCVDAHKAWLKNNPKLPDDYYHKLSNDVDLGQINEDQFFDKLSQITNIDKKQIRNEIENSQVINTELVEYIRSLKSKYKIGLLSNAGHELLEGILKANNLEDLFDWVVISSRVKLVKPQKEIFELMLSMTELKADEVLYIDDLQLNVDAANKVFPAALFTNNTDLISKIHKISAK